MNTTSKAHFSRMCCVSRMSITKAAVAGLVKVTEAGHVNLDHPITVEYLKSKRYEAQGNGEPIVEAVQIPRPKKRKKKKSKAKAKKTQKQSTPKASKPVPRKAESFLKQSTHPKVDKKPESVKNPAPPPVSVPKLVKAKLDALPPIKQFRSLADITEEDMQGWVPAQVTKLRTIEQTLKTRQEREAAQGKLVTRDFVRAVFAKIYSVDTNELNTIKERLTPAICGVFGESDDSENAVKVMKMIDNEVVKSLRHIKRLMNDYLVKVKAEKI